jgi:hypothetical protein
LPWRPFNIICFLAFRGFFFFFDGEAFTEAADAYTRGMNEAAG